jgi:hypothetical protein
MFSFLFMFSLLMSPAYIYLMLQITLHLTPSNRLRTFQLLGFEAFQVRLQKRSHYNRFYKDTQRRDFRPLEDKLFSNINKMNNVTSILHAFIS